MKLVLVKWIDAVTADHGWRKMDDVQKTKPSKCQSVGWLLKKTPKHVILVSSIGDGDCDGDITIPVGMITEIVNLEVKR